MRPKEGRVDYGARAGHGNGGGREQREFLRGRGGRRRGSRWASVRPVLDWRFDGDKGSALVMATRVVDALFEFRGYRANDGQALQWPRQYARDDDRLKNAVPVTLGIYGDYFASDAIPKALRDAVIESAGVD